MKYVNLIFCMSLIITTTIAQDEIQFIGEANIFIEGDQLVLEEDDIMGVIVDNQNLILSLSDKNLNIDLQNGLRIFQFENEGIYKRSEYTYLLTDKSRNFLAEMKFLVATDGERLIYKVKEYTNYSEGYAQID